MTRIAFEALPGTSRFFLDYLGDWPRVEKFYPQHYSVESITKFAQRRAAIELPHREYLCRCLLEQQKRWGADPSVVDKLEDGAVAVIGGQQPGLFTGPHYTILKAITAIKLARALDESGVPAVPVYWIAAEDHDYEEIHWAAIIDRDAAIQKIQVDLANESAVPVGWLRFKDDVAHCVARSLSMLPQSEFQSDLRELLESCYLPGGSPVDAFGRMMARLFAGTGLILVDPMNPDLKRIGSPVLSSALKQNSEIRSRVLSRSRAISEAGYHEQVKVDSSFTGLFVFRDRSRRPLRPEDIDAGIDSQAVLSPNVLLRPVVQDTLFPTAAYIAGPAEIAYFAQAAAVYEVFDREMPPLFPRISATILDSRVSRVLKKYGLHPVDAFHGKEFIKRRAAEGLGTTDSFDKIRDCIGRQLESLRPLIGAVDPTLHGALDTAKQKMTYQLDTLKTKLINAETRRNELLERHVEAIGNSLFPEKKLQERVVNITSFLARYGTGFASTMEKMLTLDSREHQIIEP
jgi:bacillithiol biosynthesis cysteine-adding enzyme BshC